MILLPLLITTLLNLERIIWELCSDEYHKIIISDNLTVLLSLFTYFDFGSALSNYIASFCMYSFFFVTLVILSQRYCLFCIHLHDEKNSFWTVDRLVFNMIYQLVWNFYFCSSLSKGLFNGKKCFFFINETFYLNTLGIGKTISWINLFNG